MSHASKFRLFKRHQLFYIHRISLHNISARSIQIFKYQVFRAFLHLMLQNLIYYFIRSITRVTTISRPIECTSYATCISGCQLKQWTDVSAHLRVINALIPLISIAFSVHRFWTVPVCKLSFVYPIIET